MAKKRQPPTDTGSDRLELAAGFAPPSDDAWQTLVRRIVGDRDIEETLARKTYDGIAIRPLYTARDWRPEDEASGFPGLPPFTRGQRPIGRAGAGWDVRQLHVHPDRAVCNREILEDLGRGVTSVELRLSRTGRRGCAEGEGGTAAEENVDGVVVATIDDLDELLRDVHLDACPVSLRAGAAFLPASAMLLELLSRRGVEAQAFHGALNADPLSALAEFGELPMSSACALEQLGALARNLASAYPSATSTAVDTTIYHNAGASEAQELACAVATGVCYLRAMGEAGLDIDAAIGQIAFTFATDANLFLSVAKLRAARRLWGRVAEACGQPAAARHMQLHATTSERMLTRRDPWVNILRGTVAALAAAVAGVDSMTVLPFTAAIGLPDAGARRIARNTQLVLREESSLSRVIDPAGGSWAIENLTDDLAREAWRQFQAFEREGGMLAMIEGGILQDRIAAVAEARARRVRELGDPLTGTSAFPSLNEQPVVVERADPRALKKQASARRGRRQSKVDLAGLEAAVGDAIFATMLDCAGNGASLGALVNASARGTKARCRPLEQWRLGQAFEALRDASDAHLEKTGTRPIVYLATIGSLARFTTAAAYARNLFAAGGIDTIAGAEGTDAAAIAAGLRESGTDVAVICSDTADLQDHGREVARALVGAGAREIFVVGRPGDEPRLADADGVQGFLYEGCDVLAVLRGVLKRMGILDE